MPVNDIELNGAQGTYTMRVGTNALCALEEATGKSFVDVLADLQGPAPRMSLIRHFVKATLVTPADATLEQVGTIIDDIGGLAAIAAAITQGLTPAETPALEPEVPVIGSGALPQLPQRTSRRALPKTGGKLDREQRGG